MVSVEQLSLLRKAGFAAGDFGLNLYWQSITFFLVFFYTDVIGLSAGAAGLIYMGATVFEACVDPLIGVCIDRAKGRWRQHRVWLLVGAVPLAVAFSLLYWRPHVAPTTLIGVITVVHLVFRLCYTVVSLTISSLTSRITDNSAERTTLAGLRMLFATGAGFAIAVCTQPLLRVFNRTQSSQGFFAVAICVSVVATAIFVLAFRSVRELPTERAPSPPAIGSYVRGVLGNRAFVALVIGLLFASISSATLGRSVIYYFKYVVGDENASRVALLLSSIGAFLSVPVWIVAAGIWGKRHLWLIAVTMGMAGVFIFGVLRPTRIPEATVFFVWMQISNIGIAISYWSMLPDTVEYGRWRTGIGCDTFLFGMFALSQKAGLGLAAAVFGWAFESIGYVANAIQSPATTKRMSFVIAGLSALGLIGSGASILFSPLRMGVHEEVITQLRIRSAPKEFFRRRP